MTMPMRRAVEVRVSAPFFGPVQVDEHQNSPTKLLEDRILSVYLATIYTNVHIPDRTMK